MARVQSSGGRAGTLWGLVVFAVASVVLLLISIILYTQVGKAQQDAKQAKATLSKYANSGEQSSPVVERLLGHYPTSGTVVGQLLKDNRQLKQFLVADTTSTVGAIGQRMKREKINSNLFGEVDQLKSQIKSLHQQLDQAKTASKQAIAQQKQLYRQVDQVQNQFASAQQSMRAMVQQRVGQVQQLEDQLKGLRQHAQQQVQQVRAQLNKKISDLQADKQALNEKASALAAKISQMTGQPGSNVAQQRFASADGHIVSVLPGQDEVSIDLGHEQHMLLGTTFEVFGAGQPIKLNGSNLLKGEATIQVIDVNQNSSVARVVWRGRNVTLNQGDQIVNLVYNADHPFTFAVYGKFNIDSNGPPTVADRDRIESMIRRWGGKVAESLNYNVDFLVLGQEPLKPEPLPAGTVNAEAITKHTAAVKAYKQYQQLIAEAKQMSIPVLNQDRFLTLVGYYQR